MGCKGMAFPSKGNRRKDIIWEIAHTPMPVPASRIRTQN
jgi:hypothetical protein